MFISPRSITPFFRSALSVRSFLLAAFMAASLAGCATTVTPDTPPSLSVKGDLLELSRNPPQWREGDSWHYSDDYALRVESVEAGVGTLNRLDRPGDWIKRDGLFKVDSLSSGSRRQVVFRSPDPAELLPLKVGNSVVFKREYIHQKDENSPKQVRVHRTTWQVRGVERVVVPAGTFDCWVLVWTSKSLISDWSGEEVWWYSPKVGNYVRMEYRYGNSQPLSRVLVRYQKQ